MSVPRTPRQAWTTARRWVRAGLGLDATPGRPGVLTVGVDALPLLGPRSGIGRYVEQVNRAVAHLPDAPDQVLVVPGFAQEPPGPLAPHTRLQARGYPGQILARTMALGVPPVELLSGRLDVFHGGNYLVPPVRRAATAVTVHDLTFRRFPQTMKPATLAALADLPTRVLGHDAVFTASRAVAGEVEADLGVPRERIVVVPHGVDPGWALARPLGPDRRRELGVAERYLLFLGTFEPRKNLPTLLDAHQQARRQDPDVPQLVLVGGVGWGDLPTQLRGGGAEGLLPVGFRSDEDVQALVAGAVALCSPSLYEGFGLPVLEGLATGTRVLASDIDAHREIAGGQADLLPPRDLDAWAQALLELAREQVATPQQRAARRAATADFTWQASARIHLDTYRRLGGRT